MKLKSVEIFDFKSIKHEKIDILSNQLCLVGKNESGKSSLILAISYLNILETELTKYHLNKTSENYPGGLPMIIGTFEMSKTSYLNLYNLIKLHAPIKEMPSLPQHSENCLLQLKRWGNGLSNFSVSILEKNKFGCEISKIIQELSKFYDAFFYEIYPTIQYFENEDLLIEPSTTNELIGNDRKFETFRKLLVLGGCRDFKDLDNPDINFVTAFLSDIEMELNSIFKKHYKQDDSINIKIAAAFGNKLNLIITDSSKKSFSINERSPGFQYYFSFLINKLHTKLINKNKNSIILLDEPGNGLHPKGAKDLLKTFDDISETSQILYTTHNPFLVVRNCINSLILINKTAKYGTKINKKPFLNKYQILRQELGILLNDSFLIGEMNLVVEGNTEKLAFHRLFQYKKYLDLEWLNIYNADGVNNIPQAINYLGKNNLKLSGIVVLDSDEEADKIKKNSSFKKNINEPNWEEIEINIAFTDKKPRTFEDLFPQEIYVLAFNKYCNSLKNLEIFTTNYEDFVYESHVETPIMNTLTKHFKTFLSTASDSTITKQDVIRELFDLTEKLPESEQEPIFVNVYKLCDKIKSVSVKIEKDVRY